MPLSRLKVAAHLTSALASSLPLALATQAMPAVATQQSAATSAAASGAWRTKVVGYGDGPVSFGSGRRLKVQFDGKRGDQVTLGGIAQWRPGDHSFCDLAVLVRDGDVVPAGPAATQFWTLPATGAYAFRVRVCSRNVSGWDDLQLTKLRLREVRVGEKVEFAKVRGYQYAVRVRTPKVGAAMVRTAPAGRSRVAQGTVVQGEAPVHPFQRGADLGYPAGVPNLLVEAGQRLRLLHPYYGSDVGGVTGYAPPGGPVLRPGGRQVWVMPRGAVRVTVNRPADPVDLQVGGPGLAFQVGDKPVLLRTARVTTPTTQWVRLVADVHGQPIDDWANTTTDVRVAAYLQAADGTTVPAPLHNLARLPDGTNQLRVLAHTTGDGHPRVTVRLVPVHTLPAMTADGSGVELATSAPGEWVLAPVSLDPMRTYRADITAASADPAGSWSVTVSAEARPACRDLPCTPQTAFLSDGQRSVDGLSWAHLADPRGIALLRPQPGSSGRVTLSITPTG